MPPLICSIDRQISEISPASPFGSDFIAMVSDGSVEVEDAPWTFAGFLHEIIEIERGKEGEDVAFAPARMQGVGKVHEATLRSEEHTSELQSLMRNSYAVFSSKKKNNNKT